MNNNTTNSKIASSRLNPSVKISPETTLHRPDVVGSMSIVVNMLGSHHGWEDRLYQWYTEELWCNQALYNKVYNAALRQRGPNVQRVLAVLVRVQHDSPVLERATLEAN